MHTEATATWSGFTGAPGTTKIKFLGNLTASECGSALTKVKTFFSGIATLLPTQVTITFSNICETFEDNGDKNNVINAGTAPTPVAGTSASVYSSAVGAVVNWHTGRFMNGSEIIGRTYLVPLASSAYQNDGTMGTTPSGLILSSANTLITGFPELSVHYDRTDDAGARQFGDQKVTSTNTPDKTAVLRSRRD